MQCVRNIKFHRFYIHPDSIRVNKKEINLSIYTRDKTVYFCNIFIDDSVRILINQEENSLSTDTEGNENLKLVKYNQYALIKSNEKKLLRINYKSFSMKFYYQNRIVLKVNWFIELNKRIIMKTKYDFIDNFYGLPERASKSKLVPGKTYRLYNTDEFLLALCTNKPLYGSIPFLLGLCNDHCIGILLKNQSEILVKLNATKRLFRQKKIVAQWTTEMENIDLVCFISDLVLNVHKSLMKLTGSTPLPPLFALGYHQCRWNYEDQEDVLKVDFSMDEAGIPYDSIWLDIEHTNDKRYMTWDLEKFKPQELTEYLSNKNRHLVVIIDPHLKVDNNYLIYKEAKANGYLIKDVDGTDFIGDCWPTESSWVDFINKDACEWWSNKIADYLKSYSTTKSNNLWVWNDMNEPSVFKNVDNQLKSNALHAGNIEHGKVHNIYGQKMAKASWNGILMRTENQLRPFLLSRSFFTGSQKYGAVWTGDTDSKWEHLQIQVPMMISLSICGLDFCGSDVGGFYGDPDMELLTRWYQLGALQPFFRAHSHIESKRREPYLIKDPYGSVIKNAIVFRYRILPYLYLCFRNAEIHNEPVVSPVWMHFLDTHDFDNDELFFIGSDILVRPIVTSECKSISLTLPGSNHIWFQYCFVSSIWQMHRGQHQLNIPISLESLPVFYHGGSCIFMKDDNCLNSFHWLKLTYSVYIFPVSNEDSFGYLYLDDGFTYDYKTKDQYILFKIVFDSSSKTLTLQKVHGSEPDYQGSIGQKLSNIIIIKNKSMSWLNYNTIAIDGIIMEHMKVNHFDDRIEVSDLNLKLEKNYLLSFI